MRRYERGWWYRHVPGGGEDGFKGWLEAFYWNYRKFRKWCPLLTLTAPSFYLTVWDDAKRGFETCGCGRTWFKYRLLPALVGDKRCGGGC